jgi:hypothetical protein
MDNGTRSLEFRHSQTWPASPSSFPTSFSILIEDGIILNTNAPVFGLAVFCFVTVSSETEFERVQAVLASLTSGKSGVVCATLFR